VIGRRELARIGAMSAAPGLRPRQLLPLTLTAIGSSTATSARANALKIAHGGWLPLVIGAVLFTAMTTWKRVVTLMVATRSVPHVPAAERAKVRALGEGVYDVSVQYGFMDDPNVPEALDRAREAGLPLDTDDVTYFLGRETLIVTRGPGMSLWRERLFALMARNAMRATTYFSLPPERVVELGVQVEI
jgi:K+ transporter